jgi:hypothetical protein
VAGVQLACGSSGKDSLTIDQGDSMDKAYIHADSPSHHFHIHLLTARCSLLQGQPNYFHGFASIDDRNNLLVSPLYLGITIWMD